MSKPIKITLASVAVILVLVAVGAIMVGSRLDSIFAGLIEHVGSEIAGTSVQVDSVSLQPREGRARIDKLTVANPPGYSNDPAIALGSVEASINPDSLTSDVVEVREVVVENARIHLEQRGTGNNLREILANVRANLPEDEPEARDTGKKLVINRLRLTGTTLTASASQLAESRQISLSDIVVRDIGRQSNGATAAQVASQVLEPVLVRALDATAREILRGEGEDAARELFDSLKPENSI